MYYVSIIVADARYPAKPQFFGFWSVNQPINAGFFLDQII
jgi:hypothetical protein